MEESSFSPTPPPGPPDEPPAPPGSPQVLPWEDPSRPWFPALVESVKLFLTEPRGAFERVPVRGDILRPLIFALILGWIGIAAQGVYMLLFGDMQMAMMPPQEQPGMPDMRTLNRTFALVYIFLGPVLMAFSLLLWSALVHIVLTLLGKSGNGFTATFRAMSYSYAPQFLGVLPFCGGLVGGVWSLVLAVIGISTLQSTSITNAVVAVLAPSFVFCCCMAGALGIAGALSGMQSAMP